MVVEELFRRASETFPIPVMLRVLLGRVFQPARLDAWFEAVTERQYTRELLFSSAFELMSVVVFKAFGSVHAAYQAKRKQEAITVSVTSVYNKLNGVEPQTSRALVRDTAADLRHVVADLQGTRLSREYAPVDEHAHRADADAKSGGGLVSRDDRRDGRGGVKGRQAKLLS